MTIDKWLTVLFFVLISLSLQETFPIITVTQGESEKNSLDSSCLSWQVSVSDNAEKKNADLNAHKFLAYLKLLHTSK